MNKKRTLLIIIATVILIFGIWFVFSVGWTSTPSNLDQNSSGFSFSNLFPFGKSDGVSIIPTDISNGIAPTTTPIISKVGLSRVWSEPVSGATFVQDDASTSIRFVEKATGHVYDTNIETGDIQRITNTTITKIEDIIWSIDGESFVGQKEQGDFVNTFSVSIDDIEEVPGTTTDISNLRETTITEFPFNVVSLSRSPTTNRIFYLTEEGNGVSAYISDFTNKTANLVWRSSLSEWHSDWYSDSSVLITTKSSDSEPGYSFTLGTKTGNFEKILGPKDGLLGAVLGNYLIYSYNSDNGWVSFAYNLDNELEQGLTPRVIPEKCTATSRDSSIIYCLIDYKTPLHIDDWYQGLTHTKDSVWAYNLENGASEEISDLSIANTDIDGLNATISPNDVWLMFINRIDRSLWLLPIDPEKEVKHHD